MHVLTDRFLSTPSARRATLAYALNGSELTYFYPRPPRGGRPPAPKINARTIKISIHALREEGDEVNFAGLVKATVFLSTPSARRATDSFEGQFGLFDISIHALREEGDQAASPEAIQPKEFLSTPSARRATAAAVALAFARAISIHALREEGDPSKPFFTS